MSEQVKVLGFEQDGGKRSESLFLVEYEVLCIGEFNLRKDGATEERQDPPTKFICSELDIRTRMIMMIPVVNMFHSRISGCNSLSDFWV